jgi:hypothetical protein
VPQLVERAGNKGTLGLFSGLNVVAFLLIFFLVEETARLRLEDLKTVFEYPKWKFIDFQVNETVPWFWNWVRRKKSLDDMPQLVEVVRNAENP